MTIISGIGGSSFGPGSGPRGAFQIKSALDANTKTGKNLATRDFVLLPRYIDLNAAGARQGTMAIMRAVERRATINLNFPECQAGAVHDPFLLLHRLSGPTIRGSEGFIGRAGETSCTGALAKINLLGKETVAPVLNQDSGAI